MMMGGREMSMVQKLGSRAQSDYLTAHFRGKEMLEKGTRD
jgi:hypothetical protein